MIHFSCQLDHMSSSMRIFNFACSGISLIILRSISVHDSVQFICSRSDQPAVHMSQVALAASMCGTWQIGMGTGSTAANGAEGRVADRAGEGDWGGT